MRWAIHEASLWQIGSAYIILVGNHEGKRPTGDLNLDFKGSIITTITVAFYFTVFLYSYIKVVMT
jgi:hypothetical protein